MHACTYYLPVSFRKHMHGIEEENKHKSSILTD